MIFLNILIFFFGRNKRQKFFFFFFKVGQVVQEQSISRFLFAKELHFSRDIAAKKAFMENNTSHLRWNTVECVYSRICIYHVCNETKALPEAKEQQPLRIANGLLHIQGLLIYSGLFYQFSGFNSPKGTIFSTYALLAIQCLELHNT